MCQRWRCSATSTCATRRWRSSGARWPAPACWSPPSSLSPSPLCCPASWTDHTTQLVRLNLPIGLLNYRENCTEMVVAGEAREVCLITFTSWVRGHKDIYFNSFWWFRVIFVQLFPCISLVVLNVLLFSAMRRAEQRRRRLTINRANNNTGKKAAARPTRRGGTIARRLSIFGFSKEVRDRKQRDANSTTMMLIVVIAVFLAVELPLSIAGALHTIDSRFL